MTGPEIELTAFDESILWEMKAIHERVRSVMIALGRALVVSVRTGRLVLPVESMQ